MKPYEISEEAELGLSLISITIEHNFSLERSLRYQQELKAGIAKLCQTQTFGLLTG